MDEIAGFRARSVFAPRAPADFADARQDIGDRLLLSMMMDARTSARLDLEQSTPQRGLDAELRVDAVIEIGRGAGRVGIGDLVLQAEVKARAAFTFGDGVVPPVDVLVLPHARSIRPTPNRPTNLSRNRAIFRAPFKER